ncbi:MAG TPA: family 10 glycosylhydrolase [Gemmatimonas sp.]|uniref:glycoside hydrolase family 10 protein n=1 Tax=Gemmatimonas sp. TaxID=1962908 RepID=UPI002ED8F6B8
MTTFTVPAITREFRGMWIATVANIDWPSRTGLSIPQQQAEMVALLDVAQQAGLNAVILHVRAAGDALYPSTYEPWMRSFSGTQGGDPGWDPLQYAIEQSHARGIELHAWFNPFRAGNVSDTARLAETHFGRRRPDVLRRYCSQLWFDPGEAATHDQAIAVVSDVVRRYALDGVHIDDYFYPYPEAGCTTDFPDSAAFAVYQRQGGTMTRGDWRRDNVNRFVERLYTTVRGLSRTARVGISPFGIWRPGNPAGITGLDAYASIYADSRLWMQRGWADYFAPQLYWSSTSVGQNFGSLLTWWTQQNTMRRHLWPGLASYRIADGSTAPFAAGEISTQIGITRSQAGSGGGPTGSIFYNASSVKNDRGGFVSSLKTGLYADGALPPATTWLESPVPVAPTIAAVRGATNVQLTITSGGGEPFWWLVRWRTSGVWRQRLLPQATRTLDIPQAGIEGIVVNTINRTGVASSDVIWRP